MLIEMKVNYRIRETGARCMCVVHAITNDIAAAVHETFCHWSDDVTECTAVYFTGIVNFVLGGDEA